ncbi:MAG: hypothetical protein EA370_16010 [Wenzhouxiangella sp.]|nr:MAG: hypothetical protein EA370_16010 [Wenzhouxiangella sp.]
MSAGVYEVHWSASGPPFQQLATMACSNNGNLVQLNLSFSEHAESKLLDFKVVPITSGGLAGAPETDDVVIQRGVVEAEIITPEDGYVVGVGPEQDLSGLRARPVETLEGYVATSAFRVYFRDMDNPAIQTWTEMEEQPDGSFLIESPIDANDFSGFGSSMAVVARPTFSINGVNLRVLTPAASFQNNPVLTYHIDPDLLSDLVFKDRFEQ